MSDSQQKALAALVAAVEDAWNTHDMSTFAARFAEDADFINVRGWWWRGRDEIERRHALLHETMFGDSSMNLELASTRKVCPGVVLAHVRWRRSGMSSVDPIKRPSRAGASGHGWSVIETGARRSSPRTTRTPLTSLGITRSLEATPLAESRMRDTYSPGPVSGNVTRASGGSWTASGGSLNFG